MGVFIHRVVFSERCVFGSGESDESLFKHIEHERVDRRDEDVDSEVHLIPIDQKRIVNVVGHNVV